MRKVSIVSLGCPKNLVDSDTLLAKLGAEGFLYTGEAEEADLVLVNTCGFIEDAKRESVDEILKLRHITEKGGKLLVFGCLAKRYGDELKREIPEIDGLWGVGDEDRIVEYCKETARQERGEGKTRSRRLLRSESPRVAVSPLHQDWSYAYLKVAEGCSRGCTYCVIPSIRGPFRSVEPDSVLERATEHLRSGAKELVLVAQDLGNYGREYKGYGLSSLVRDLSSLSGEFWIRLLYLNPSTITDDLLKVVATDEKVCKYIDMPLQHSEDKVLKAMGRGSTKTAILRKIKKIREAIPGITLRTTFIVGFPGETEEDVAGLKDFIERTRFEHLGVFTYSKEEGTPAAGLKGQVPRKTRERRRDEIMRLQSSISLEKNKAFVGKRFKALVEEVGEGAAIARLSSQAPEIDGVVIIDGPAAHKSGRADEKLRVSRGSAVKVGEFLNVRIVEAYDYDLKGEVLS